MNYSCSEERLSHLRKTLINHPQDWDPCLSLDTPDCHISGSSMLNQIPIRWTNYYQIENSRPVSYSCFFKRCAHPLTPLASLSKKARLVVLFNRKPSRVAETPVNRNLLKSLEDDHYLRADDRLSSIASIVTMPTSGIRSPYWLGISENKEHWQLDGSNVTVRHCEFFKQAIWQLNRFAAVTVLDDEQPALLHRYFVLAIFNRDSDLMSWHVACVIRIAITTWMFVIWKQTFWIPVSSWLLNTDDSKCVTHKNEETGPVCVLFSLQVEEFDDVVINKYIARLMQCFQHGPVNWSSSFIIHEVSQKILSNTTSGSIDMSSTVSLPYRYTLTIIASVIRGVFLICGIESSCFSLPFSLCLETLDFLARYNRRL